MSKRQGGVIIVGDLVTVRSAPKVIMKVWDIRHWHSGVHALCWQIEGGDRSWYPVDELTLKPAKRARRAKLAEGKVSK